MASRFPNPKVYKIDQNKRPRPGGGSCSAPWHRSCRGWAAECEALLQHTTTHGSSKSTGSQHYQTQRQPRSPLPCSVFQHRVQTRSETHHVSLTSYRLVISDVTIPARHSVGSPMAVHWGRALSEAKKTMQGVKTFGREPSCNTREELGEVSPAQCLAAS